MPPEPENWEDDEDEFDHFTDAQDAIWDSVMAELQDGRKISHWMWFVFPVLEGVGESPTALFFALRDVQETREYLAHETLGPRLTRCMDLIAAHDDKTAAAILGKTDAYKLHNCATLFARAADDPTPFDRVLEVFFDGKPAQRTLDLL
ncbi:hypothetical protein BOO69_00400 [Sulfitobacter alexandrii]|uniref:DUF1810 domain-containing protein n=1 Tax=Sulfitobacter alexandrii TaxID=1917485 RepID=A0A1J0WCJ6_9RHOB|nr:DUF1810 domain-containing protein [Sulfitobacter alexandrii]APE42039.1 hypothetical protein BOO69_00400 [Sulfitobacter alexandrii]